MDKIKKSFEECKRKKLLLSVELDEENIKGHIEKAKHYLKAVDYNMKDFQDVAVASAFYAMYHALLALLRKHGYVARAQECAINAVQHLIIENKINLDMKYIDFIRLTDKSKGTGAKNLREELQYGIKTSVQEEILETLKKNAIEFVEVIETLLYTLKEDEKDNERSKG